MPKLFEAYDIYVMLSETMTYQFNNLHGAGMGEGVTTGAVWVLDAIHIGQTSSEAYLKTTTVDHIIAIKLIMWSLM